MEDWKDILNKSITSPDQLLHLLPEAEDREQLKKVCEQYPMRINGYYSTLLKKHGSPLWLQAIPDQRELDDHTCMEDPLAEELLSPVTNVVHKYPDRVLFLISNKCSLYCRFCTRKRKVGKSSMKITPKTIEDGIEYLRKTPQVREVLLSGGDPLLLEDEELDTILSKIHAIKHIEVIRIGSRVPCTLPMRITPHLVAVLKKYHPLYINTHFNHPDELTPEASRACEMLADGGIPLGCQTVLLKGINDDSEILKQLFLGLLKIRVKPYYLFQGDLTKGTDHFRTPTSKGVTLMRELIGNISGMAIPTLTLDAPNGKGKIPLTPQYIMSSGKELIFENYLGEKCIYPEHFDF